jgi:hypothetical protein
VFGRSDVTEEGEIKVKSANVEDVTQKLEQVAAQQKIGVFKPVREKDQLTVALGNEEHTGRVRAVSSHISRKEAFPQDAASYKKRDRYKMNLEQTIEEKVNNAFETRLFKFVQEMSEKGQLGMEGGVASLMPMFCPDQPSVHTTGVPSSVASTPASTRRYPVDAIKADTPCRLHVPIGRAGNKTKAVATAIAIPGNVIHNNPIPNDYAKVTVIEVTDDEYLDYVLDHSMPEGITQLGHAVKQFILWHKRDIELDSSGPSPVQQNLFFSQVSAAEPQLESPQGAQQPSLAPMAEQDQREQVPVQSPTNQSGQALPRSPSPPPSNIEESSVQSPPVVHHEIIPYNSKTPQDEIRQYLESLKNKCKGMQPPPTTTGLQDDTEVWEEDGEMYTREKLFLRKNEPIYKKEDVPERFVLGRPMQTTVQLSKRYVGIRRLHNWYMMASSLGLSYFSFVVPENAFWSGQSIRTVDFKDLWAMFRKERLECSLLTAWCL